MSHFKQYINKQQPTLRKLSGLKKLIAGIIILFIIGGIIMTKLERKAFYHAMRASQLMPEEGRYLNLAGYIDYTLGEYDKAIGYYEQALATMKKELGDHHPSTQTVKRNLERVQNKRASQLVPKEAR